LASAELSVRRPLLSIVTVNYNNRDQLFATVESVSYWRARHRDSIEYLIIDGRSDDLDSLDIAKLKQISDIFICESDDGIYDAMNKGLRTASGEYVYFLNSGDLVIDLNIILQRIRAEIDSHQKAVLAFRSLQTFGNVGWERPRRSLVTRLKRMCAHQATVVPLDETQGIVFDVSRPISADTFWMHMCIQRRSVKTFPDIVAIFQLGGVSNRATFRDQLKIYRDHPDPKNLLGLIVKPMLLMILGYEKYFRLIYSMKYAFVPDVDLYLRKRFADRSFLNHVNLTSLTTPPRCRS
jgi:glycosyltransferase involved in cell wall biosynthesis